MGDKAICKLVKKDYLKKNFNEYVLLVKDGKYVCRKCGRVARSEKNLCKPVSISGS